ncbi:MAG: pyridoxal phosphate-dependent decarboxylase family protein [Planctomycetota bacterium]|jgi:glutamate/tyrosine decarboxylase-like PLP-dependent enzyme
MSHSTHRDPEDSSEISLDPRNWEELRELGERMLADMLEFQAGQRERPTWTPLPEGLRESFLGPAPHRGEGASKAYEDFRQRVLPYATGNAHPRYWGWVRGSGTPLGMLADMLAAGMNSNLTGQSQAPVLVEMQVIDWFKDLFGFPGSASGLLLSGGSVANLNALAVARNAKAGFDVREEGLQGVRLSIYASEAAHTSIRRAVEILGLGRRALCLVPVDAKQAMDPSRLQEMIQADRDAGLRPICVVGTAGTTDVGAVDDLQMLAEICARHGLWFHVDGAFGALLALTDKHRDVVAGMERADSLAFDLHKWMCLPYEIGGLLVRNESEHRETFELSAPYLEAVDGGAAVDEVAYRDYGIQLSRSFRALKAWLSIKAEGIDKFARIIEQNVAQAQRLGQLIESEGELELVAPVRLNIVCFRFAAAGLEASELDELNKQLLIKIQENGVALPSSTRLAGQFCLRVAITNHRTRMEDMKILVEEVLRVGRYLLARSCL